MKERMLTLSQQCLVILVAVICVFTGVMIFMVMEWPRTLALILVLVGLIAGYFLFGS